MLNWFKKRRRTRKANTSAEGLSIGIIMDGNGRWAKRRGLPRSVGHKKGSEVFNAITQYAKNSNVRAITYYAFSTENWSRPQKEVDYIMDLFGDNLKELYKHEKENNRIVFLGDRTPLRQEHVQMMQELEQNTKDRTGMILNVAINYGGREEILKATKEIAAQVAQQKLAIDSVDAPLFEKHLYTAGQPMPDFILRTSGEIRLSNFLMWQSAYSELVFTDVLWPDFTEKDFDAAVAEYHSRDRRFGNV